VPYVVSIPWWEWAALPGNEMRQAYLATLLWEAFGFEALGE